MSVTPRARRAATVVAAYWPVPITSTLVSLQFAIRLAARSSPRRTSERSALPTAVVDFTALEVREAAWNNRSRPDDTTPDARDCSSARLTCPAISSSPMTTDLSPEETSKRWGATSVSSSVPMELRSAADERPVELLRISMSVSLIWRTGVVSAMSRYASNRLQVESTTAPFTPVVPRNPASISLESRAASASRISKLDWRWLAVKQTSTPQGYVRGGGRLDA